MSSKQPILGSSRRFPLGEWAICLVWNAYVVASVADFRPLPGRETLAWLALGAFAVVGVVILRFALVATQRWNRFQNVVLDLDPYPGEAGGLIAGSVIVPVPYDAANRFVARINCTEQGLHGGQLRKSNSYRRALYQDDTIAAAAAAAGGTRLSFRFAVPPEAPATDGYPGPIRWTIATAQRVFVRWSLEIEAQVPGVDLAETFEIPVRRVPGRHTPLAREDTPDAAGPTTAAEREQVQASDDTPDSQSPAFVFERVDSRIRVTQPAWKKPIPKLYSATSLIFGIGPSLGFVVLGGWLLSEGKWEGAAFALLGIGVVVALVGYLAHALEVEVAESGIRIEWSVFGRPVKHIALSRADIAAIEATADSEASQGQSTIVYDVSARMRNGSTHLIAASIPRARDASLLRDLVAKKLAVEAAGSSSVVSPTTPAGKDDAATRPWLPVLGIALPLVLTMAWPFLRDRLGASKPLPAATQQAEMPAPVRSDPKPARSETVPAADDWLAHFHLASDAKFGKRPDEALREYDAALQIITRTRGADDPLAAAMFERIANVHTGRRNHAESATALRSALAILEKHSHAAVRAEAGLLVDFDRESVLRALGWASWELRRYAESLAYYQRAYDMVAELDLNEAQQNRRLAYNSAGIMVGACTQSDWTRAERAMVELKERMSRVSESDREWLDYWVRTGEPRLAARNC